VPDNKERSNKAERDIVPERCTKELDGYVGFANLPNQVYRKAVKKGFDFTLMVVGESGLGNSTLMNSMFLADIYSVELQWLALKCSLRVCMIGPQIKH
jgi:septin 7